MANNIKKLLKIIFVGRPKPFENCRDRVDYLYKFLSPLLVFIVITTVQPFGIPEATRSISRTTVDRLFAPFYKSADGIDGGFAANNPAVVVLIDDSSLAYAGERWPIPTERWAQYLPTIHLLDPSAVFLDVMIGDLREYSGSAQNLENNEEIPSRCNPCVGGLNNPINRLSCNFKPAQAQAEDLPAHNWTCVRREGQPAPTPLVVAGANPRIYPTAVNAQILPRCETLEDSNIDDLESHLKKRKKGSKDTVLECLRNTATVVPIQWRAPIGEYPIIVPVRDPSENTNQTEDVDYGFEPSAALRMLWAYCEELGMKSDQLPKGCQDFGNQKMALEKLNEAAKHGDNQHHLVVEWRMRPPTANKDRDVAGCETLDAEIDSAIWRSLQTLYRGFFAGVSDHAAKSLFESCPPILTYSADFTIPAVPVALSRENSTEYAKAYKKAVERFHGAAVFVGGNIALAPDSHFTPVHQTLPGVYFHAMAFDNLLTYGKDHSSPMPSLRGFLKGGPAWLDAVLNWPLIGTLATRPYTILIEGVCYLVIGALAVWQYHSYRKKNEYPALKHDLKYFGLALACIFLLLLIPTLSQMRPGAPPKTVFFDWILLFGVAILVFRTAIPVMFFRATRWFFGPRLKRVFYTSVLVFREIRLAKTNSSVRRDALIRLKTSFSRNFSRWGLLVFGKLLVMAAPLMLIVVDDKIHWELAHVAICITLGILLLAIWALFEFIWQYAARSA